tara:strand:+ start:1241 stop:2410 length:1170 start_codon:yes stop_codon:yes gene_type:complete
MGFLKSISKGFKKIGKGIKKHFKSIGKGIKSAMGKIGKFMGKIGIVGQIALMFTPVGAMLSGMMGSIGNVAGSMFGKVLGKAAVQGAAGSGLLGSSSAILRGAGTVLKAAGNFAQAGHSAFRTITDGISSFVGEFSKTALKKIPGMENVMPKYLGSGSDTFFGGENSAWGKVSSKVSSDAAAILDSFNEDIGGVSKILTQPQTDLKAKAQAQVNKTATGVDGVGPMKEGYKFPDATKSLDVDVSGLPDVTQATESLGGGVPAAKESLLSQVTGAVKENYTDFLDGRPVGQAVTEELIGGATEAISEGVVGGIKQRAYDAVVPVEKIESFSTYVAPLEGQADIGAYASAAINDRAMQIQVSGDNYFQGHPYGFGASKYVEQMAQATGGNR